MEKIDIIVPKGIRYIGEWKGDGSYRLENYPFPHILDKVLTGCGFTEYCLTNDQNVILCSPRKMLLENKEDQHMGKIYYARNDIQESSSYGSYDMSLDEKDLTRKAGKGAGFKSSAQLEKEAEAKRKADEIKKTKIQQFKSDLLNYYYTSGFKAKKVIVTYDSFKHVKEAFEQEGVLDQFQVVIDEFQSVLVDVKFKTDTELALMNQLRDLKKVCFVSATPLLDKYIEKIDEFKDLPYYRLDWEKEDPSRIINPNLNVRGTDSIFKEVVKVINRYKEGKFERCSTVDEKTGLISEIESKEAVLYVNSVKTICTMIVKCELTLANTNVLCARTPENEEKVRKAFNDSLKKLKKKRLAKGTKVIGSIPKRGESHKMFTFCTRTVYLGADFYSTNARTFVFSDANIDCLTVDISMDLPQILGRQRLTNNPWKNSADVFVKSSLLQLSKKNFDDKIQEKIKETGAFLKAYDNAEESNKYPIAKGCLTIAKATLYKDNYLAVDEHTYGTPRPVFNNLMWVADQRAFDIQQIDYKDRVSVFNTLKDKGFGVVEIERELSEFEHLKTYIEKMRFVCQLGERLVDADKSKFDVFLNSIPISFKNYYTVLGPIKCSAAKYQKGEMEKLYQAKVGNQDIDIKSEIFKNFKVGDRISNSEVKERLKTIYHSCGYQKTPKANDLEIYFETKHCFVPIGDGSKRSHGMELVSKKEVID